MDSQHERVSDERPQAMESILFSGCDCNESDDEAVGDVSACRLRTPKYLHHLSALQAVVARHRIRHLDARQLRVLQTAAGNT